MVFGASYWVQFYLAVCEDDCCPVFVLVNSLRLDDLRVWRIVYCHNLTIWYTGHIENECFGTSAFYNTSDILFSHWEWLQYTKSKTRVHTVLTSLVAPVLGYEISAPQDTLRISLTQFMTLTVQNCLEIWRISLSYCCCFLFIQARSSIAFRSLWTFTNSLFIKHCHQIISN